MIQETLGIMMSWFSDCDLNILSLDSKLSIKFRSDECI